MDASAEWREEAHKRGGNAKNPGQFSKSSGGATAKKAPAGAKGEAKPKTAPKAKEIAAIEPKPKAKAVKTRSKTDAHVKEREKYLKEEAKRKEKKSTEKAAPEKKEVPATKNASVPTAPRPKSSSTRSSSTSLEGLRASMAATKATAKPTETNNLVKKESVRTEQKAKPTEKTVKPTEKTIPVENVENADTPVSRAFSKKKKVSASDMMEYSVIRNMKSPRAAQHMEEQAAFWNDKIGISPYDFIRCMMPLSTQKNNIETNASTGIVNFRCAFHGKGNIARTIDFKRKKAVHAVLELPLNAQGTGIAKKILSSQVETYKKLGLDGIEMHANIDVGGYAWLKYGYTPSTPQDWQHLKRQVKRNLSKTKGISKDARKKINSILDSPDPRASWLLSDLNDKTEDGKSVAKSLLLGTEWEGELSLKDNGSMERFNSYVGQVKK
jgi:hypothetical protein